MGTMRVRFAPSPTGPFHIGGARSALFNWLLARHEQGKFLIRIEDTDLARSTRESEENIKEALRWLGMDWDEGVDIGGPHGPYRQTERLDKYRAVTEELLARGEAYHCYCSKEELEAEKAEQEARGETPKYTGRCRHLTAEEKAAFEAEGRVPTVRLRVPENKTYSFDDMVRGHVAFESNGVGDFVVVKSDGVPVYNYAVVVDDHLMEITHVIRAEEHLSNTPRQIAIYQALGWDVPTFGHISLILGTDKKKMSKRHGATSVDQYRQLGYLPEALNNFLALLGWAPEGEEELFTTEELIECFSMDRVAKNPAVFDIQKLNWINFHYMKKLTDDELYELCLPHLQDEGYASSSPTEEERDRLILLCKTVREHLSYGAEIRKEAALFFRADVVPDEEHRAEIEEVMRAETVRTVLDAFSKKLVELEAGEPDAVKAALKEITKETGLKGKAVFMPIRIALTGSMHGPDLNNIVTLLGRDTVTERLAKAETLFGF